MSVMLGSAGIQFSDSTSLTSWPGYNASTSGKAVGYLAQCTSVYNVMTKVAEIQIALPGSVASTFDMIGTYNLGNIWIYGRLYKNGVAIGTLYSARQPSFKSCPDNYIAVTPGDLLQIYAYTTYYTDYVRIYNWKIMSSTGVIPSMVTYSDNAYYTYCVCDCP